MVRVSERNHDTAIEWGQKHRPEATHYQFKTIYGTEPPYLETDVGPWVEIPKKENHNGTPVPQLRKS